jgi:hypothetical protein
MAMQFTPRTPCPRCGGSRVVGGIVCGKQNPGLATLFVPWGLKLPWLRWRSPRVPFMSVVRVCSECGLLWSEVDLGSLRRTIMSWGTPALKDVLGPSESLKGGAGADELA